MVGFTDRLAQATLNSLVTAYSFVGLFTAVGTDAGTGFTEVSGGSYARFSTAPADWNAATGSSPSTISNLNPLTFNTATANWGTVIAWGLFDALTSGHLGCWDYVGNFQWLPAFIRASSPASFLVHGHSYMISDTVVFTTEYGGQAPIFRQSNLTGLLAVAHTTTDIFDVTNSAVQVNTAGTGDGSVRKIVPTIVNSGAKWQFDPSTLVISLG